MKTHTVTEVKVFNALYILKEKGRSVKKVFYASSSLKNIFFIHTTHTTHVQKLCTYNTTFNFWTENT